MFLGMPTPALLLWGSATLLTLILFGRCIVYRQYRELPFFVMYLAINLLQTAIGIVLYQSYGFMASRTYDIAWTTQGIVVIARALAAAEVCYRALGAYRGIWALAARILVFCGLLVLCVALYFGKDSYLSAVVTLEVGLEACIATALTGLFVFARYYRVAIAPTGRLLGLGLGLLSCFKILNDLVFERLAKHYGNAWNYASLGAFLTALLLWTRALRDPLAEREAQPGFSTALAYAEFMPQVNRKLADLNEQLARLWQTGSQNS